MQPVVTILSKRQHFRFIIKCHKMSAIAYQINSDWTVSSTESNPMTSYPMKYTQGSVVSLQWRRDGHNGVSNHRRINCLLNVCSGADKRKHQSSASLAFVKGIHRWSLRCSWGHRLPVLLQIHLHSHMGPSQYKDRLSRYGDSHVK